MILSSEQVQRIDDLIEFGDLYKKPIDEDLREFVKTEGNLSFFRFERKVEYEKVRLESFESWASKADSRLGPKKYKIGEKTYTIQQISTLSQYHPVTLRRWICEGRFDLVILAMKYKKTKLDQILKKAQIKAFHLSKGEK